MKAIVISWNRKNRFFTITAGIVGKVTKVTLLTLLLSTTTLNVSSKTYALNLLKLMSKAI